MTRSARFWDRLAERYSRQPIADERAYRTKLQITQDYLHPDMEVLEFGCGTGSTAILHAPLVKHILAIDISSKMLEIAERKAKAEKVRNITFEQASFDDFDAPDGTFDAVLGLSILHLLDCRDDAIAKVHRMLKPGGIFVTSTVCLGNRISFIKLVAPIGKMFGLMPLLRFFTVQELEDSMTRAGFSIDHKWQPDGKKWVSAFMVAKKAA